MQIRARSEHGWVYSALKTPSLVALRRVTIINDIAAHLIARSANDSLSKYIRIHTYSKPLNVCAEHCKGLKNLANTHTYAVLFENYFTIQH